MISLSTLRKRAAQATHARGHVMQWRDPFGRADGPKSQLASCRKCGAEVVLHEYAEPNRVTIGGEALALHCTGCLPLVVYVLVDISAEGTSAAPLAFHKATDAAAHARSVLEAAQKEVSKPTSIQAEAPEWCLVFTDTGEQVEDAPHLRVTDVVVR